MYSPKISEEVIPYLYQWAKSEGVSMTALVNRIINNEIEKNQKKERTYDEKDKRNPQWDTANI
jgi:post-segregation antitoxin (ccd killing protein)